MQEEVLETTLNENNIVETEVTAIQKDIELDHSKLDNLDYESSGHTGFQPAGDYVEDVSYVHTDNNYTTTEKTKLASLENYDDTEVKASITSLQTNKADKSEIPDVSNFITKDVNNLTYYTLTTNTGSTIELSINSSTYVMTMNLKNTAGTIISTDSIDLPIENVVVNGSYDSTNQKIVLTLQSGDTIDIPVGALISGLQTEITANNKLSSDLVDDTNHTNKFVTASEKEVWNSKVGTTDYAGSIAGVIKTNTNYGNLTNSAGYLYGVTKTYAQYGNLGNELFICKGTFENAIIGKGLVSNIDYASANTGGVIKVGSYNAGVNAYGILYATSSTYSGYGDLSNNTFISKGTLENVITGKGLLDSSKVVNTTSTTAGEIYDVRYINSVVGDINTILTTLVTAGGNE